MTHQCMKYTVLFIASEIANPDRKDSSLISPNVHEYVRKSTLLTLFLSLFLNDVIN